MKLIMYTLLFIVSTVHGSDIFSYPHKEYAGVTSKLYKSVCSGKVSTVQELISSVDRTEMKDAEFNSVIARVLYRIYSSTDPALNCKFDKKIIKTKLAEYAVQAAKCGSTKGLSIISELTTGYEAICSRAMIFMLTKSLKDCVILKQKIFAQSVHDKDAILSQIFGKTVSIPDDYPEDDHGRTHTSPVLLDFSTENIFRLENIVGESNGHFKNELLTVLKEWKIQIGKCK